MFHNLRFTIFVYYLLTVLVFIVATYYFLVIVEVQNILLFGIAMFSLILLSSFMISKLAIDPLKQHITNLQNLSKETLHELNLPISTIVSNISMLKKRIDDEKNIKRLKRIESACEMLQNRYNELDYVIRKQSLQEIKESFFLDELLKERVDFLKQVYPHFEFNLDLQTTKIFSDKIGLSKVIDNLVDNGVKYSPNSNRCDITLKNHTVYIKDYGCGMDEVELIKIFDRYYQSNENMQGFGIGLSIVKRFCDTNAIDLKFISKLEKGTTVLLKFKEN